MCEDYQKNYYLAGSLLYQIGTKSKQNLLNFYLAQNNISLTDFTSKHQHELYHLFCLEQCCQCTSSILTKTQKVLNYKEMEVLFNSRSKMQCHKPGSIKAFCCSQSKVILHVDDLDITLLHCLLINICVDLFWCNCLYKENKTFEKFLNDNNHVLFHLWKRNEKCCKSKESNLQCKLDLFGKINDSQWAKLFETTRHTVRCNNTDTCHFSAKKGIMEYNLDNGLACVILGNICPLFKSIQKLSLSRNTLAHSKKGELSDMELKTIWSVCTECILEIARFLGKENEVKGEIDVLMERIPSANDYKKLHSKMLDTYTLIEDISDKWNCMFIHESERTKAENVLIRQEITDLRKGVNQMNKGMVEVKQMLEYKKAMAESDRTNVNQLQDDVDKMRQMMLEFKLEGTVSAGNQFQRKPITKKLEANVSQFGTGAHSDDSDLDSFKCGTCNQLFMETSDKLIFLIVKHRRECSRTQDKSTAPHTSRNDLQKTSTFIELSIEGTSRLYQDSTIQYLKDPDGFEKEEISIDSVTDGSIIILGRISKALCYAKTSVIDAVEGFLRTLFITYPIETDDAVNITVKVGLVINEGNNLDEEGDYLICGKCKREFMRVSEYISHQRTECKLRILDETEKTEAKMNSSSHEISIGCVDQIAQEFDSVSEKNDDLKAEAFTLSRSDKEYEHAVTKCISGSSFDAVPIFGPSLDIVTDRIDDMQTGTSADQCSENSLSSINIESSTINREMDDQVENYIEQNMYIRPHTYTRIVPQHKPLSSSMRMNNHEGFSYVVDDIILLQRYICLGTEGGNYFKTGPVLNAEFAVATERLLARGAGPEVLKLIVDLSVNGRTMKQTLLLRSLFICAKCNDSATKSQAYSILLDVCRIPTHLFEFVGNIHGVLGSGWGRSMRSGISNWYNSFENNPKQLVYLITKYKSKHGWSHRDLLRLAHIKPKNRHIELILNYINFGLVKATRLAKYDTSPITVEIKEFLVAIEKTGNASTIDMNELKTLIIKHELVKEHIHNKFLGSKDIWECLLRVMPATAMLRNLGKMSNLLLLEGQSLGEDIVIKKLDNINKDPKIHPLTLFAAWWQYASGQGDKGHLTWPVNENIRDALENAFFQKFGFVQPTHKKICIAVEHSREMRCPIVGTYMEIRDVAAAVALSIARIETDYRVVAFTDEIMCLPMDMNKSLLEAIEMFSLPWGGIDCTLPIKWAVETKTKFDAFVVFTGSESFSGNIHFVEALKGYRKITDNEDVRVVVVGMSQNEFSIADPCDPRMLNIVGFDKNAPKAIQNFLQTDYHIIKSKYSQTGERTLCQDFLYN